MKRKGHCPMVKSGRLETRPLQRPTLKIVAMPRKLRSMPRIPTSSSQVAKGAKTTSSPEVATREE